MIGFDGSPDAEAAVETVAERVWPAGSAVRLVMAVGDPLATAIPALRWVAAQDGEATAWWRRGLEDAVHRLSAAGLSVTPVIRRGDPRQVLVEEVRRWSADALVVGARGLRGIKRFLLGSVSTAVVARAPCTVEVVRPVRRVRGAMTAERLSSHRACIGHGRVIALAGRSSCAYGDRPHRMA